MTIVKIAYFPYKIEHISEHDLESNMNRLSLEFETHKDNNDEIEIWIQPNEDTLKIIVQNKIISNSELEEIKKNDLDYIVLF
ncbi:MAG: hypothetical protein CL624_09400 [Arcobacter sp.]|nr:hypothetical protein [Arcobacter sp.]|tara:strand:- start:43750 stop:43995 length:246 start_codon:yes stop_codon:yes gene_type:complete